MDPSPVERAQAPAPSWLERFGAGPRIPEAIWLHAASVGEVRAAASLVERLRASGEPLLLSTMTATGRSQCADLHPELPRRLAPLDLGFCVNAALRRCPPRALVMVEAELWPTWIRACEKRGAPVLLVSARMSDRTFHRHRRLGGFIGRTLRRLTSIGARTELDRERFVALGADPAQISVTGDLKLDHPKTTSPPDPELEDWLGSGPLVIGGSIHPGEELALLQAREAWLAERLDASLLLAPRHPKRVGEIAKQVRRAGLRPRLRSELGAPLAPGEVGILDSLGELSGAYSRARVAFVGGTLVPIGGHNLLEPVDAGAPVCFGPNIQQQRHVAELLQAAGAGRPVADAGGLADAILEALRDAAGARARADSGRRALDAHRGSSERAAELIARALAASRLPTSGQLGATGAAGPGALSGHGGR